MASISKAALATENSTSFPNNDTGYITPELLRNFNTDMIDSTVNQTVYTADSTSFDSRVDSLESFSSSLSIDYINQTELNAATQSLSASLTTTINGKLSTSSFNGFSASVTQSIIDLQNSKANLVGGNTFTGSQIIGGGLSTTTNISAGTHITASGNIVASGFVSASGLGIQGNSILGGNAFDTNTLKGTVYIPNTLIVGGVNFNDISASLVSASGWITTTFPPYSASVDYRLDQLESWSSSLDTGYVTEVEFAPVSQSVYAINVKTSSLATTGSNTFNGNQIVNGTLQISSSATYDLDITGAWQTTAASRISGSQGINQLTQTFNQISSSTGLSIMSRGYLSGQIGSNQIAIFSSGSSTIGSFTTAPIGIAGIAINSGSIANQWYYPIQFQPSTGYTDGRVRITTPLSASIITGSNTLVNGILTVSSSSNLKDTNITGSANISGSLFVTASGGIILTGSLSMTGSTLQITPNGTLIYDDKTILKFYPSLAANTQSVSRFDKDGISIYQYQNQGHVFGFRYTADQLNDYSGSVFRTALSNDGEAYDDYIQYISASVTTTTGTTINGFNRTSGKAINQKQPFLQQQLAYFDKTVYIGGNGVTSSLEVSGSTILSGSARGVVESLTVNSNTASINCNLGNFFTLAIPTSSNTLITAFNINPGQTVAVRLKQDSAGTGSVSFGGEFKFITGSQYTGSQVLNSTDLLTFVSFDNSTLLSAVAKNLV